MGEIANLPIREKIDRIEKFLKNLPDQMDIPPVHHFSKGLYARELFIPKHTLIVGKIHKYQCLNTMIGDISVLTEDGVKRLTGVKTFTSPPGVKRVGWTHSDTMWICYHATEETDLDKLEDELIAKTYDEVCLETIDIEALTGGGI
jgi:hypothetical protein